MGMLCDLWAEPIKLIIEYITGMVNMEEPKIFVIGLVQVGRVEPKNSDIVVWKSCAFWYVYTMHWAFSYFLPQNNFPGSSYTFLHPDL